MGNSTPLKDRFWAKVVKTDYCWVWTGYKIKKYGNILMNGRPTKAHRVSWVLQHGSIPKGMSVLHKCDNPPCVRPDHLFLGTQKDNMQDAWKKGRRTMPHKFGETANGVKLTAAQVVEIRAAYRGKYGDLTRLSKKYGVDHTNISCIVRRKTWRHIQ